MATSAAPILLRSSMRCSIRVMVPSGFCRRRRPGRSRPRRRGTGDITCGRSAVGVGPNGVAPDGLAGLLPGGADAGRGAVDLAVDLTVDLSVDLSVDRAAGRGQRRGLGRGGGPRGLLRRALRGVAALVVLEA